MTLKIRIGLLRESRRHVRSSHANADAQLRANEWSHIIDEEAVGRVDVVQLSANRPVEDYFASAKCLSSNTFFFGIFDGHAGPSCGRYVSSRLYDYISAAVLKKHVVADLPLMNRLQWLFSSSEANLPPDLRKRHEGNVNCFYKSIVKNKDITTVRKSLQAAFSALDGDITMEAIKAVQDRGMLKLSESAIKNERQRARSSIGVATSGSCAVVAHVREDHLHVANVGDSAAVMGVCNQGSVTARLMSKAHCIENTEEADRVRKAHPLSESASILRGGRLLSELFPLRAFGDVRYKWSAELQKKILVPFGSTMPPGLETPPYLTAVPEVLYHRLTTNDQFLVLASDGLWEWLEPDVVVRLVSDHVLGAQTLHPYFPKSGMKISQVHSELKARLTGCSKHPLDENSATHILRHALGGCSGGTEAQYRRLVNMLQLPPGMARNYRDDITVIVIHFNNNYIASLGSESHESSSSSRSKDISPELLFTTSGTG